MTGLDVETKKKLESNFYKLKESMKFMTDFLSQDNYTLLYELDYKLKQNPKLLEEFKKDPSAILKKETGLTIPEGSLHFHYIDNKNNYYPEESGSINQLMFGENDSKKPWTRIEMRFGIGPGCIAQCDESGDW